MGTIVRRRHKAADGEFWVSIPVVLPDTDDPNALGPEPLICELVPNHCIMNSDTALGVKVRLVQATSRAAVEVATISKESNP